MTDTINTKYKQIDSNKEDQELIKKALNGDEDSFTKLMNKYHDAVYSVIKRIIHDKEEIPDLVQETFIKAFASLKSFNENYAFATWIFKIATNN